MTEVNLLLLLELVLLLLAVDVIIIVRFVIRRRREKTSIERLVTLVRRDAERRETQTRNLLEKKYGYSGEQLEKATKKIVREEKRIYQLLANLFATRDNVAIENLSINFEEAVEPYRALMVPKGTESSGAGGEDDSADVQQLKDINQTLNEELRVTMNTLSKMLHEYSVLLADNDIDKEDPDPDAVAALVTGGQVSEDDTSSVAVGDAVEEGEPDVMTEAAAPAEATPQETDEAVADEADENVDSASLVGMFQEDDDDILAEDGAATTVAISEASAEALSAEEAMLNEVLEPENVVEESEPVEDSLAQEIGEVLENTDVDLSDIELSKIDAESKEEAADQAEELLAQAIGETLEGHETPLPDFEDELLADEADATAVDPTEELLAQAIGETLESHETPLPDLEDEVLEDDADATEADPTEEQLAQAIGETLETHETELPSAPEENVLAEPDAEKKLTDEIAETLSGHTENMSDEDIDSLLQGAIEDVPEK